MNKFMGGLTVGIILTASFFMIYNPFQKKASVSDTVFISSPMDTVSLPQNSTVKDSAVVPIPPRATSINKNNRSRRDSLVAFAKSLLGTPYLYGSSDPAKGFDCSGFITYVFNHFKMVVPRSSYGFENLGTKKTLSTCQPGDLILFTGTDPLERTIGHIGIVCDITNGVPSIIHSSSGKAHGVTITSMDNKFYLERFISVIDVLL